MKAKKQHIVRHWSYKAKRALSPKLMGMGVVLVLVSFALLSYTRVGVYTRTNTRAEAATSDTVNFQARLLNASGGIVADGNYDIEFNLYASSIGGSTQWTETRTVAVKSGYLSVYLGSVTPFSSTIEWDQEQWLTMNVEGDGEMSPRLKLTAVPFAFQAAELIKTSGANRGVLSWLTPTGDRTINLPDASGTVALSSGGIFTNNGVVYGNGTSVLQSTAAGLTGQCFVANTGSAPTWGSCASGITLQQAYDNSTGGIITVSATDGAVRIRDDSTTFGNSNIFSVQNNGGSVDYIAVQGDGDVSVDTNTLFVDATANRIGIGNIDPDTQLTIASPDTTSNQINLRSQRAAIATNSVLGGIQFSSNDTTNAAPGIATVDIRGIATATHTATVLDSALVIRTTSGTVLSEVARFTANNRLGIGTTAPTGTLGVTTATPSSVAGATGTAQISVAVFTGGLGGDTTIATTGTGGAGGAFSVSGGIGGTASAALVQSTGGAGGALNLNGGVGGSAAVAGTGNNVGGTGGAFVWQAGTGGLANGATSGNNTGGNGGAVTLQAGTGGAANTGTGNLVGGTGGTLTLRAGTGGLGSTGGGNGGAVTLQGGTAAAMAGAAGGAVTVAGAGGSATGSGGNGGALALSGGSAGGDNSVNRSGGAITISAGASRGASAGGAISLTAGSGGQNLTIAANVTGPASGGITINGGNGGTAPNATTTSTGGAAGGLTFTGGIGGAASVGGAVNNVGGGGGTTQFVGGTGGAANGATSGNNTGGAGGGFVLQGGTGGAASVGSGLLQGGTGGTVQIRGGTGGTGTTGGNGGAVTIQGGASAAIAGAAGGAVAISGTQGSNTGSGGNGGALTLSGGNARGDNTVSRSGGNLSLTAGASVGGATGGTVTISAGAGGQNLTVGTATGGAAGGITFNGGNGNTAPNATTASTGGSAGGFTINGGTGGAASVAGTGTNTGGAGGSFTWSAGTGGAANGATSGTNTGGAGGAVSLTAGTGGAATVGSGTLQGGNGGNLTLTAGRGGAGTVAGAGGDVVLQTSLASAAPTERLRVTSTGYVGIGTGTTTSLPNARLTVVAENTTSSQIKLRSTRSAIVANDVIGGLDFDSNDSSLTAPGSSTARIQAIATATHSGTVLDTALLFSTASGPTLAERWRINSTGEFQGNGASTVRANSGNLTLSTLTSGNVVIDGAGTLEVQDNTNINSSQLTINSSSVYTPQAIANAGSVPIGASAATTVDVDSAFIVTQTTVGTTKTLHTPTSASAGRVVYVTNSPSSTTSFTLYGVTLAVGATQGYIWNGSAWTAFNQGGAGGVTSVGAIDSQSKSSDGAVISGTTIYLQTADVSNVGLVGTGSQTFNGVKTFDDGVTITTGGLTVSAGGIAVTGNSTIAGTLDSLTGLASTGTIAFSGGGNFSIDSSAFDVNTSGAISGVTSLSLSGAISGGTTYSGSGNINTTGGVLQTNTTTRIDNSGNLLNIGNLSLSGTISGGTTYTGSGDINTTGGNIQTNTTTRIDNSGNLLNIGNITGTGAVTFSTGGIGSLILKTQNQIAGSTNSADVSITSGNASGATSNSGNVDIDSGTATGTAGLVRLGGTNASGVELGRSGTTTSVLGVLDVNGITTLDGNTTLGANLLASGSATLVTGTATATPGSNTTTILLTAAGSFANNDVIYINNAGQDYYTRIVSGGGTTTLTVSPAVDYDASATITKYNVQNIGADTNDYSTQANRFFQGYFLGGVVVGAGSTTLSDGNLSSTGDLVLQRGGGLVSIGGNLDIVGTISGNGSGITNIDGSAITGGSIGDSSLSSNVALLSGLQTFSGQKTFSAGLIVSASGASISGGIDNNSGNITEVGSLSGVTSLSLSGAISGGTTISGSGDINTSGGSLQTGGVTRIDNSGNLTNIGSVGASGNINTTGGVIQTNSTTRLDNSGALQNITSLSLSGAISGGTSYSGSGDINTSGGSLQTAGVTRIDNSGNLSNIGNLSLSGTISGGTTITGTTLNATTGINTGAGAGTERIDASGNLINITALTLSGAISGGTTYEGSGNINTTGGVIQTNSTTRIDNSGNLTNITALSLSGAISGGTTISGSGDINTSGGSLQTGGITRVDNSGNLSNIGNLSLSGSISGGTTISGSGNINSTSGGIQTNSTTRIDNSGNLVNIGDITGTGAVSLSSGGTGSLTLKTLNQSVASTNSASISLISGNASGSTSNSGDVTVDAGTATGTAGIVYLGTANASAVNIGRTGTTTTIDGLASLSGNTTIGGTLGVSGSSLSVGTSSLAGTITLNDGSSNTGAFQTTALGSNRTYTLPDSSGTVCLDSNNCSLVQLAPGSEQVDSTTNSSININKTGASGDILTLEKNGSGVFTVFNDGATQISTDNTAALQVRNAGGTVSYLTVNTSGSIVQIGSSISDATGILFVLDSKSGADPAGVNGGSYYNTTDNVRRCYDGGVWSDCSSMRVAGEATISSAQNNITVTLNGSYEYLHCRIDVKGRSVNGGVYLRFNSDAGGASYGWNEYDIINTAVGDAQDSSDSEIQLTGTDTSNIPASADLRITNFSDTQKIVDWSYSGATGVGTNNRRYSGTGNWANTSNSISTVQFLTSTGNFNAGSHAWCEGRNVR